VPLLRDVMTAILVRFEWHGDCPGSGAGPPSYTLNSSLPNDRSVQQGDANSNTPNTADITIYNLAEGTAADLIQYNR
jgi:hypothetical protein